jgi:hypothetical protein
MPWNRSRPGGNKTAAKYRSKEHAQARAAMQRQLDRDGYLTCAQDICIMRSRLILPGMKWHAGHDDTGTRYIGPVHPPCNLSAAGRVARARQNVIRIRL